MSLIEPLTRQLTRDEGVRHVAYQDSRGIWTLGVGHNLSVPISDAAITQILQDDIQQAETACLMLPFWFELSEPRKGALLNLTFNEGIGWVGKNPKMLAALRVADYEGAAAELLDGPYKDQVGLRAYRIATQLRDDRWV